MGLGGIFKKVRGGIAKGQVKLLLKQLEKAEKQLQAYADAHPEDEQFQEDYKVLKENLDELKATMRAMLKKKNVDFMQFVELSQRFADIMNDFGQKYDIKDYEKKASVLRSIRIDNTASTFDASKLDEEELKRLAEELKKKKN